MGPVSVLHRREIQRQSESGSDCDTPPACAWRTVRAESRSVVTQSPARLTGLLAIINALPAAVLWVHCPPAWMKRISGNAASYGRMNSALANIGRLMLVCYILKYVKILVGIFPLTSPQTKILVGMCPRHPRRCWRQCLCFPVTKPNSPFKHPFLFCGCIPVHFLSLFFATLSGLLVPVRSRCVKADHAYTKYTIYLA